MNIDPQFQSLVSDLTRLTVPAEIENQIQQCEKKFQIFEIEVIEKILIDVAYSGSINVKRLFCSLLLYLAEKRPNINKSLISRILAPNGSIILERFLHCLDIKDDDVKSLALRYEAVITENFRGKE